MILHFFGENAISEDDELFVLSLECSEIWIAFPADFLPSLSVYGSTVNLCASHSRCEGESGRPGLSDRHRLTVRGV